MASSFEGTNPIKRQHTIEGYEMNILIDADGIHFTKKGDKHRGDKPTLHLSWSDAMEIAADRQKERGELKFRDQEYQSVYDFLHLEE